MIGIRQKLAKTRDSSELEYLRGIIRNLRSENKSLKKQLSRSQKKEKTFNDYILNVDDSVDDGIWTEDVKDSSSKCPKCKSNYTPIELGIRSLHVCNECGWTGSSKKG